MSSALLPSEEQPHRFLLRQILSMAKALHLADNISYPQKDAVEKLCSWRKGTGMKSIRCIEEQIWILQQAEAGARVVDLCRQNGISEAPFYKWHNKFGEIAAVRIMA